MFPVKQAKSATILLPGERHLRAGKGIDGRIWMQIDDQPRVNVPPGRVVTYAVELLKLCGVQVSIESVDDRAGGLYG